MEKIYVINGTMMDGSEIVATYTANPFQAQEEYLGLIALDMESVHIEDANTGEVYAFYYHKELEWGTEVSRGVSREFTEILAGLRA